MPSEIREPPASTTGSPVAASTSWPNSSSVSGQFVFANRNETKHLPYGEGTLRAAPLGEALAQFERPATVITESPDLQSDEAIREELYAAVGTR